jgi:hypothetical protein
MIRIFFAMCWLSVFSLSANAQTTEAPSTLAYTCDPSASWIELGGDAPTPLPANYSKATTETIDARALMSISREDRFQHVYRTGSKTITRTCGRFTVRISDGDFTSNPDGAQGAYDFPVVEVLEGKRSLTGIVAIGTCDPADGSGFSCPENWAVNIEISHDGPGDSVEIRLSHEYEETRSPE